MITATLERPVEISPVSPDMSSDRLFRISVPMYHEMIRDGILGKYDPVELIEGLLVKKMPKNPPHRITKMLLLRALMAMLPPGWSVDDQDPVTTSDSEPEPDMAVFKGTPRDLAAGHPTAEDTALVVEISESTLAFDRGIKKRLYARAGFATYWIVNLIDRQIEVHEKPSGDTEKPDYAACTIVPAEGTVAVNVAGKEIGRVAVKDILP